MITNHKILIANRGEIAIRIMNACRKLGIAFACVYTAEDTYSGHVEYASKYGGEKSLFRISSYNDANEILCVADEADATAVHPGYGFFAENYRFARRVVQRDRPLVFIGPSWKIIRTLGDKINTKRIARSMDIPTVPGSDRPIYDEMEAESIAKDIFEFQKKLSISHPAVLIKASAGGGGMGIEEVYDLDMFRKVYRKVRNYAGRAFFDEGVLIEQRIKDFYHIEAQILADRSGKNIVHFGTRNCSIQSSGHQKRIEVAPGFDLKDYAGAFEVDKLLNKIVKDSVQIARKIGYDNMGTWEWIVTKTGVPYLMEVNTRIQVENGISAARSTVRGKEVDLVAEQIRTALGEPLGYLQSDIDLYGLSMEYRIVAEDVNNGFIPSVGAIDEFSFEKKDWLEVFSHLPNLSPANPYTIPTEFDPNLALAVISATTLPELKERGKYFLDHLVLKGHDGRGMELKTNISFLRQKTDEILKR